MANNPYVNKVVYGNDVVMDITDTTAEPEDVAEGEVFYTKSGSRSVGTGNYYSPNDTAETDIQDGDYFPFFDISAGTSGAKRKTLWSNIKNKLRSYFTGYYVIELTYAQYQALSTAEKNDPDKVYYVNDYASHATYVELDDTTTAADKVWSSNKVQSVLSHVGMVIHSTTLDTEAKVKAVYGGTTWVQLSGYVLRGATQNVTPNQNLNDGGADSVTVSSVASHNHTQNSHTHTQDAHNHTQNAHKHDLPRLNGIAGMSSAKASTSSSVDYKINQSTGYASEVNEATATNKSATATNQSTTATNNANGANYTVNTLPKYKNVYIWERTA